MAAFAGRLNFPQHNNNFEKGNFTMMTKTTYLAASAQIWDAINAISNHEFNKLDIVARNVSSETGYQPDFIRKLFAEAREDSENIFEYHDEIESIIWIAYEKDF